ncbi:MAG: hypothetical protein CL928_16665, partial [Deltaproteobacteria bacterium]|nr:hypothetical protein [Deltaproteobacteria bacterium]
MSGARPPSEPQEDGAGNSDLASDSGALGPGVGESLDRLSPSLSVLQRAQGHRSATDDILAAWIAWMAAPQASKVLDLGCGHGTVTLHLSQVLPAASFLSVEVQSLSADLARRNVVLNGLEDRIRVLQLDLRELELGPGDEGFDLATGTPP